VELSPQIVQKRFEFFPVDNEDLFSEDKDAEGVEHTAHSIDSLSVGTILAKGWNLPRLSFKPRPNSNYKFFVLTSSSAVVMTGHYKDTEITTEDWNDTIVDIKCNEESTEKMQQQSRRVR